MNRRQWMMGMGMAAAVPAPDRVVAAGDVHGDYERFLDVLIMAGVANLATCSTAGPPRAAVSTC
mgnify:CR=1 FL=1